MSDRDEQRDESAERREAAVEPAVADSPVSDVDDDDDVVDAHVWRAQT
jgi:hypothetical protein